jgi:hypothetical protein
MTNPCCSGGAPDYSIPSYSRQEGPAASGDGSANPGADHHIGGAVGALGRSFPGDLNAVDLSADVDLIDDDREIQPADLGQRRKAWVNWACARASRRSMISALGESI